MLPEGLKHQHHLLSVPQSATTFLLYNGPLAIKPRQSSLGSTLDALVLRYFPVFEGAVGPPALPQYAPDLRTVADIARLHVLQPAVDLA